MSKLNDKKYISPYLTNIGIPHNGSVHAQFGSGANKSPVSCKHLARIFT